MKVHFGSGGKSHRRGGRTLPPQNPPGETSPNPAQSRSRRWQCLHRRGGAEERHLEEEDAKSGQGTRQKARQGCPAPSGREPASAAAAEESSPTRRLRGVRAGPGRAAPGVPAAGGHGAPGASARSPRLLRRGSPRAGRSPSLRGLALASAPLPCPGPGAPTRAPNRPAAVPRRRPGAPPPPPRSSLLRRPLEEPG